MPKNTPKPKSNDDDDEMIKSINAITHVRTVIRRSAMGENIRVIARDLGIPPRTAIDILSDNWEEYIAFLNRLDEACLEVSATVHLLALLPQRGTTLLHRKKVKEKMGLTSEVGNSITKQLLAIQGHRLKSQKTEDPKT